MDIWILIPIDNKDRMIKANLVQINLLNKKNLRKFYPLMNSWIIKKEIRN